MNHDIPLKGFVSMVDTAIARVDGTGRFGHRKVFVSAIWSALRKTERRGWSLSGFKARLFEAHRAQLLSLARADLVAAMPIDTVNESEIEYQGATFHFVVDSRAEELWASSR